MSDNLPDCSCGANSWHGGGAQIGPGYQFYGRTCGACRNILHYVGRDGWWVALILPKEWEKAVVEYVNTSMVIQARAYRAEWEAASQAKEKREYDDLVTSWGLDPAKGCIYTDRKILNDAGVQTGWEEEDVVRVNARGEPYTSKDIVFDYLDNDGNRLDIDRKAFRATCRQLWDANPRRSDIVRAPDPINVPYGVTAYVLRDQTWDRVVPGERQSLPQDPLRAGWDTYFMDVFRAVQAATGTTFTPVEQPNGYYKDLTHSEPWFQFNVAGAQFTIGPRKRVINLQVAFPGPRNVTVLRDLAEADSVTYSASGQWRNQTTEATAVTIHAWTKDKTIEYLTAAVNAATGREKRP